ncbi:MAG: adenylate/guanylate cyclase domain-containing protein [Dehalococcoidia bacterium]|nr:adenylate/guanylate cyclase domain-containing protein [Dehalococcoidia bacterium]
MAEAAWASGHHIECIQARERAYAAFAERKDTRRAAQQALDLFSDHLMKADMAVAGGWYSTAQRLLADQPECPEHGRLVFIEAFFEMMMGKFDRSADLAQRMSEIGTRFGDRDLQMLALLVRSDEYVSRGRVSDAVPLLDEAMAAAISGELRPSTSRTVYCTTVGTCQQLADFRRAGEWTEATERCNARESIVPLGGDCRVHRAGILRVRGAWDEAEAEARSACDELFGGNHNIEMGRAMYEIGEIQMRRGDLLTAEDSFQQTHSAWGVAQPGIALLRLAQGRPEDAFSSIKSALVYQTADRLTRARMLPAQVEIAIAVGDLDTARSAADELEAIASDYATAGLEASAACVRGALQLAEGDAAEAVSSLRRGWRLWQEVEVPYEAARARMLLAAAYVAQGDHESARSELHAAKSAFERLGAAPDARRAAELLDQYAPVSAPSSGEAGRATRTFMFTDIVKSTNLVEAMGDEAWENLLRWHDQTMRTLLAAHQGEEVKQAGDGFFFAFPDSVSAIECAVAIQRTLADHRTAHGFAPQVRIGLHVAEATRRGRDYSGKGIHETARIAALGNGGEILASEQTLAGAAGGFATSEARTVSLKGITKPVQVVAVDWR